MERGISPGEPGWYFVPFLAVLAAPLMLLILAAALVYEIAIRLDPRRLRAKLVRSPTQRPSRRR
jgi:hypothetical protein